MMKSSVLVCLLLLACSRNIVPVFAILPIPPTKVPITTNIQLKQAIRDYMNDPYNPNSVVATTYGYPIGTWDVSALMDFREAFDMVATFNQDISGWVRA